jgi:putative transcriptional regulator
MLENDIRVWRAKCRMSQEELAKHAGVTRQTILAVENGKYGPSLELGFRIAKALGARIEEVFRWVE